MKYRSAFLLFSWLLLIGCSKKEQVTPSIPIDPSLGLGHLMTQSVSNDKSYHWYFDQGNTGPFSNVNCGPTVATMAIKWVNEAFSLTPQDARSKYKASGGWWYTNDILSYFHDNSIGALTLALTDISVLKNELDGGNIVILCLDMYYVNAQSSSTYHVDKFYNASTLGWGHFMVIKGYKVVDDQIFYEAYDPYSFGVTYSDNSPKGARPLLSIE